MRKWLIALGLLAIGHICFGFSGQPEAYCKAIRQEGDEARGAVSEQGIKGERVIEPIVYGDMDQWVVRYITESKLLGGKIKTLYALGSTDTIRENQAYIPMEGNPWGCSATYAKFMGIETGIDGSVVPERRGYGYCCKMQNVLTHVNIGDIYAMVSGTIYMGQALEPLGIAAKSRPYTATEFGVPFTKKPAALMLDYKAKISDADSLISTERNKPETITGHDCAVVYVYLQHRWEDAETGRIYARRVGTAYERICETIPEWINNHEIPIRYGCIKDSDDFQAYEDLNQVDMMARNSKGKMVKIEEVGWSLDEPTHVVMYISSSNAGVFRACEGNTLWVDNLRWVYEKP